MTNKEILQIIWKVPNPTEEQLEFTEQNKHSYINMEREFNHYRLEDLKK